MILPCNLSDPNIEIIMGSFVDTATSLQRAHPIELWHDRMSFMLWTSKKSRFTC